MRGKWLRYVWRMRGKVSFDVMINVRPHAYHKARSPCILQIIEICLWEEKLSLG